MMRLDDPWDGRDPDRIVMRRRLAIVIAGAILILVVLPWLERRQTDSDRRPTQVEGVASLDCPAEDELVVVLAEDGYGLSEGEAHCVHIDVLVPPPPALDGGPVS